MGPFPFIQFGQAEINGNYGNEYAYRKTQIQVLNAFFVDNFFVGYKFFIAVDEIRNFIIFRNQPPNFASLELVLPNPYPTSIGVEVYTLKIAIQQNIICYTSITFNLTDGVVTASDTVFTAGPDVIDSPTNGPYIAEELRISKTLSVYQQNGAAIFPDTFTFDSTTGIAERRLLRAYDWKFNETFNQPQRDGITDLRMIPKTLFRLRELSQIEKSMVSFFLEKPIKQSITDDNWNSSYIKYLNPLPDGWVFDTATISSIKKQVSISNLENKISFILAGIKVGGKWYFQRFVDPYYNGGYIPQLASIISTDYAANPNAGKLYYSASPLSSYYYDFDQCEFGKVENEEPFNFLIKSGDSYQINIPSDFIFEPGIGQNSDQFPFIGIFNCNEAGGSIIGQLKSPYEKTLQWNIAANPSTGEYYTVLDVMSIIDSQISDIILFGGNTQYTPENSFITIPYASLNVSVSSYDFADSIINYLNANGFPSTYTTETITGQIVFKFVTSVSILENGIIAVLSFDNSVFSKAIFINPSIATQYQASITIPPLLNSNYFIGIFQNYELEGQEYKSLLAMSQPLQLDNFEDFTQILEYGANENSIIEGFEYINGWLQKIRVPLNGAGQTAKSEESIYRNSDGTFQKPENSTDEVLYLHTDYLDLQTQRAMISATKNPIFVLGGQNLSVQGDLEITNNQDFTQNSSYRKLQQMKFQALTQGYQPENNSCIG
jgi:hypothetical protein